MGGEGCCGRVGFPTSMDVVEGWGSPHPLEGRDVVEGWGSLHPGCCVWVGVPYIHYYLLLLIRFAAPWRKCNATGAEYDDDGVDVGDVDGDDGGVIYYYYCDYYSQSALDCFLNSTILDHSEPIGP